MAGWPRSRLGIGRVPWATVDAASAIPNGETRSLPWPNPSMARSVLSLVGGTPPVRVVAPGMAKSTPIPSCLAASVNAFGDSPAASGPKVVLQEKANAACSGMTPLSKWSSLGISCPLTWVVPGHGWGVSAAALPDSNAATAVTILKVEPGGNRPISAIGPWAVAGAFCATACNSPVEGRIATSTAGCGTGPTAASAAVCTLRAIVVATGGAGAAG